MRLLILLLFVTAALAASPDPEDLYTKFLDRVINSIQDLVERTDDPSPQDQDRLRCIYGMNAFLRHATSSWALTMIDSATKLQSGLLKGNLIDLGQFDQCVGVTVTPEDLNQTSGPGFSGQHCLVSINFLVPNNTLVIGGEPTRVKDIFGQDYIPVTVAQCYPSLCRPWVLEEALNGVFALPGSALEAFGVDYRLNTSISPTDCSVLDSEPMDALDWVVGAVVLFIIFLAVISTSVDYFYIAFQTRNRQKTATEELMVAFSLYTNVGKLLDTKMSNDTMLALNGMKFFSMAWVILSHRYRYLVTEPLVNLLDFPNELKNVTKMFIVSGPLAVDSFFLISGLLNTYSFCIMREKKRQYSPKEAINGYIHRFFRLTPAYLMMIAITSTWLYRLRQGPMWYKFVGSARRKCRDNFWMNLIYLNNYLAPNTYCMMQSWYLSADMQMFWLSPFVIYPLWRWPIYGFIELIVLIVASILSPVLVSYLEEIRTPIPMTTDLAEASKEMALLYLPTHTKAVSYILGIGAGYIVYKIKNEKIKFKPDLIALAIGWLVAGVLMIYSIFGGYYLYQLDSEHQKIYSAFFIGFQRFFWSLGLIWIIFTCILGYGGPINTILSWKLFIPLGRLTYCVYLTHIAVILTNIGAVRVSFFYSDFDQVERFFGDLVMSILVAGVLSMLLEAPMMKIEKLIFGRGGRNQPRRNEPASATVMNVPQEVHNHQA